jgi:hypothetical protein
MGFALVRKQSSVGSKGGSTKAIMFVFPIHHLGEGHVKRSPSSLQIAEDISMKTLGVSNNRILCQMEVPSLLNCSGPLHLWRLPKLKEGRHVKSPIYRKATRINVFHPLKVGSQSMKPRLAGAGVLLVE